MKYAYLAGGCFWCITPEFDMHIGVHEVTSGYCGGTEENPTYEQVKHQQTGHRETIRVAYDPQQVSYAMLINLFLDSVDPFDAGGQYIDRGHSYTLAVYYQTAEEKQIAEDALFVLHGLTGKKPCVAVEPFGRFWPAEEYHQQFYKTHPFDFERELIESGRKKKENGEG